MTRRPRSARIVRLALGLGFLPLARCDVRGGQGLARVVTSWVPVAPTLGYSNLRGHCDGSRISRGSIGLPPTRPRDDPFRIGGGTVPPGGAFRLGASQELARARGQRILRWRGLPRQLRRAGTGLALWSQSLDLLPMPAMRPTAVQGDAPGPTLPARLLSLHGLPDRLGSRMEPWGERLTLRSQRLEPDRPQEATRSVDDHSFRAGMFLPGAERARIEGTGCP
jgi:hypothetical protein